MDGSSSEIGPGNQRFSGRTRRIGASVAAGAVLLGSGIGIGVALTGGASASTAPASGHASAASGRCARAVVRLRSNGRPVAAQRRLLWCDSALLRLALAGVHGEVTYKAKNGFRTVAFERGTVQTVSSTSVTVKAADGTTWTWEIVKNTVVRESGQSLAASKLATGEQVMVAGQVTGGARDARLIRIRPAA
jgi:hypothetical protein